MSKPGTPKTDRSREQGLDNADPHPQTEQGYDRGGETANAGGGPAKSGVTGTKISKSN